MSDSKNSAKKLVPRVLHEDQSIIVIDKPAGVTVHPAPSEKGNVETVASWAVAHYPEIASVGEDPERPGIVHRLDRDTSGVMVIARTQPAYLKLKRAFKSREVSKRYAALIEGDVPWNSKRVELSIARTGSGIFGARHPNDVAALPTEEAKASYRPAVTEFSVTKKFKGGDRVYTLLEARPLTGRTHQIRVHLKAIGFPVVGDALYAPKKSVESAHAAGLDRHFLHAAELSFLHPESGAQVVYGSPLPDELQDFLGTLS